MTTQNSVWAERKAEILKKTSTKYGVTERLAIKIQCTDPAFELTIDDLDGESTFAALIATFEEETGIRGPFAFQYGSPPYPFKPKHSRSLFNLQIGSGERLIITPEERGQVKRTRQSETDTKRTDRLESKQPPAMILIRETSESSLHDESEAVHPLTPAAPTATAAAAIGVGAQEKRQPPPQTSDFVEHWPEQDLVDESVLSAWYHPGGSDLTAADGKSAAGQGTDDELPPSAPPSFQRQHSYMVMGKMEINQRQKDILDEVMIELKLTETEAAILLRSLDWNKDELLKAYQTDKNAVRVSSGLPPIAGLESALSVERAPSLDESTKDALHIECPLCAESVPYRMSMALHCSHRFCLGCWGNWVRAQFQQGTQSLFTTCIQRNCNELIPSDFFLSCLSASDADRYRDWLAAAFVRNNIYVKWCPRPGCGRAVEYTKKGMKMVDCHCGMTFCFSCGHEAHDPAPCEVVQDWNKRSSTDASIFQWIAENKGKEIKHCTKCRTLIEKNQGCQHMTCRGCRHEFCWLCFQDWRGHDGNLCQRLIANKETVAIEAKNSAGDFHRYQQYFTRHEAHRSSSRFAEAQLAKLNDSRLASAATAAAAAASDAKSSVSLSFVAEDSYMENALKLVMSVRRLLSYAYCWSFYIHDKSSLKDLLQSHMARLEEQVERLHGQAEATGPRLPEARSDMVDLTRVLSRYLKQVVEFARSHHTTWQRVTDA